jgi:hypothetical protein
LQKTNKIIFKPSSHTIKVSEANPINSASLIPAWYKDLPRFVNNSDIPYKSQGAADIKMCSPFRDAIIHGYLLTTPCDLEVTWMADGTPEVTWNPEYPFSVVHCRGNIETKNVQAFGMPVPIGCSPFLFAFDAMWGIETPLNYSVLITQPLNRYELPFMLTSGIMDTDMWKHAGRIPFFIRKDFEGIIPKGTPFAQIIPISRDDWEKEISEPQLERHDLSILRDTYLHGFYVKFMRQKKSFK